jgi:hypothetical protein
MLIVAIPKSASTSLMRTLGNLHNIPAVQIFPKNSKEFPYPSTKILHLYHSDMREITDDFATKIASSKEIFKQHIPPTTDNLGLLSNVKKVILLRNPEQIIEAYYRAEITKIHKPRQEFKDCKTLKDWKETARKNGLLNDLVWFHDTWIEESKRNSEINLVIKYSELLHNTKETINLVEQHFELPIADKVSLAKERYSRSSLLFRLFRKIKNRWKL